MIGNKKQIKLMVEELDNNKIYELKEYKEKRSNQANKYFWKLLSEICLEMGLDVIEEYKKRVRGLGIFKQWELKRNEVKTFNIAWSSQGIAWFVDIVDYAPYEKVLVNAYYGSSSYNTKQMAKLIDGVVQDAEAIGIETKSPNEIKSMLEGIDG